MSISVTTLSTLFSKPSNGTFNRSIYRQFSQSKINKDRELASTNEAYQHKIQALKAFLE
jgi:hypothetical protein